MAGREGCRTKGNGAGSLVMFWVICVLEAFMSEGTGKRDNGCVGLVEWGKRGNEMTCGMVSMDTLDSCGMKKANLECKPDLCSGNRCLVCGNQGVMCGNHSLAPCDLVVGEAKGGVLG